MAKYNKAVMALLGSLATLGGLWGVDMDPLIIGTAGSVLTTALTYFVPNAQ